MRTPDWAPAPDWLRFHTIEAHTEGEPFRVITSGFPDLPGATILERRRYARQHYDHLRTALMWEPRGHADMYGCVLTPPVTPGADLGILFLHNEGFSTMCGHGIIAIATVAVETGMVRRQEPETTLRIDTPAGLVTAQARLREGRVHSVSFRNVPSFVLDLDAQVEVPGLGRVSCDLAFGGAFYAFVSAAEIGLRCVPGEYRPLIEAGTAIKRAVMAARAVTHPFEPDLSFLYGTIFTGPAEDADAHSRHVCIFAEGEVDRSPTGTGVSARLALLHARGGITLQESVVVESILGTRFTGRVVSVERFGPYEAVIPEVEGTARIVGRSEYCLDPQDPLRHGFLLR
jgi:proline racemase